MPTIPWTGMIAAIVATLPEWLNLARGRRSEKMVFAPEPLAPDYSTFAKAFLESAARCAADGATLKWTLCPYCGNDGAFAAYRVDLCPAKAELVIGAEPHLHCCKTDIILRPRLPLPIVVRNAPVTLVLSPTKTPRQIFIDADRQFAMPWNRRGGNLLRDDIAKLWPALAFAMAAAFPNSALVAPERLAAVVVAQLFATFALARKRG